MSTQKRPGEIVKAAGILLMTPRLSPGLNPAEFLLMRHSDRWDLPKGHCEAGESFVETALRETEEETGITRNAIDLDSDFQFDSIYPVTYKQSGDQVFEKHVRYFLGFVEPKPSIELTEHESAKWFPWSPPHQIQTQTIDPLIAAVENYLGM